MNFTKDAILNRKHFYTNMSLYVQYKLEAVINDLFCRDSFIYCIKITNNKLILHIYQMHDINH